MTAVYSLIEGSSPLLLSVPHDGRLLPGTMIGRMTSAGLDMPDTDWHVTQLYDFAASMNATVIAANYSRYVVDLNRSSADDDLYPGLTRTGLCPLKTFQGDKIYSDDRVVGDAEKAMRIEDYWRPYHQQLQSKLDTIRERHGYALLWDAHSIPSVVPRLFEGELPVLNIGTNEGNSCDAALAHELLHVADESPYEAVMDARFKGGFITRHYGKPDSRVMAVQLEIAQRAYMDETSREFDDEKADTLRVTLRKMLESYVDSAK